MNRIAAESDTGSTATACVAGLPNLQYGSDGLMTSTNGATYTYDPTGQRVRKDTSTASTEYFFFDGQLLAMRDPATGNWTDRIYGPNGTLATVAGTQSASPAYRLGDHLGSLANTTDGSGNVTGTTSALPFGQLTIATDSDRFPFTDHERDNENNTDNTLFRHYSVAQGRWLSPDPYNGSYNLTDPQSLNRYAYLSNRPMADVDRVGFDGDDDGGDDGDDDSGSSGFVFSISFGDLGWNFSPGRGSIPGAVYVDAWINYLPPASASGGVANQYFTGPQTNSAPITATVGPDSQACSKKAATDVVKGAIFYDQVNWLAGKLSGQSSPAADPGLPSVPGSSTIGAAKPTATFIAGSKIAQAYIRQAIRGGEVRFLCAKSDA